MRIIIFLLTLIINVSVFAQSAGTLDSSFGIKGKALIDHNFIGGAPNAIVNLPDGRIIASCPTNDFALVCFLADGTPDKSFGSGGYVQTNFIIDGKPNSNSKINSLVLLPDGKILAGGWVANRVIGDKNVIVARYLSNGKLDSSFGNKGAAIADAGTIADECISLLLLSNNKILAVGDNDHLLLVRFTAQGYVDSLYGTNGKVITDIHNNGGEFCVGACLQSDGKPVVLCRIDGNYPYTMIRFTAKGIIDSTFGINGIAGNEIYQNTTLFGKTILATFEDKIILGGVATTKRGMQNAFLFRYLKNGQTDSTFGVNGFVYSNDKPQKNFYALAQQKDGKIIAAGSEADKYGAQDILIGRYRVNGLVDSSFGTNGFTINKFEGYQGLIISLCIQKDGKILAGSPASFKAIILRYKGNNNQQLFSKKKTSKVLLSEIKISPNPVINQIQLTGLSAEYQSTISITDLNGNTRLSTTVKSENYTWDLSLLPKGIYTLSIRIKQKEIYSCRFLKQ